MFLVTGANGFIGSYLVDHLKSTGSLLRRMVRTHDGRENTVQADLSSPSDLLLACQDITTVVHCAGYAHAFSAKNRDKQKHWQINFEGTRNLVEAAGQAGVKKFIFLSSVKAMADPGEQCADESWPGLPETDYGASKRAAEEAVLTAGAHYGMHVVNLRLAMVYGPGGRGNLERMSALVKKRLFPPLPETSNRRSMVHVEDVVLAVMCVVEDQRAAGRTYIIAGSEAPSGRQLYDSLRDMHGLSKCLWAVPAPILRLAATVGEFLEKLTGVDTPLNQETLNRLLLSAWYSSKKIEQELRWTASHSFLGESRKLKG